MNRILFLDNSIQNDLYKPLSYWEPVLLFEFDLYRASAGELPADLEAYSHIFISGSTASVLDNTDWINAEQEMMHNWITDDNNVDDVGNVGVDLAHDLVGKCVECFSCRRGDVVLGAGVHHHV